MRANVLFIVVSAILFMIDLCANALLMAPRCFFITTFFYSSVIQNAHPGRLVGLATGIVLEAFITTGVAGSELISIIPLGLLLYFLRKSIDLPLFVKGFLVVLCTSVTSLEVLNIFYLRATPLFTFIFVHFISALFMVCFKIR
ncbi:hypothetical protein H0X06_00985 [Candidatus Dependentiae bacterium]|nr:hypothetical protein [Candidatus Dependentiae bacterium]